MSDIIYNQQRWNADAEAQARRRRAVAEAGRKRERAAIELHRQTQNATATAPVEHSVQQLVTLRSELAQLHEVMRDAMVEYVVQEFEALRLDLQRMLKRQVAEIERDFETKLAALRMPRIRGTYSEVESYRQHDVAMRNGNSYIARRDAPGPLPGPGWQQLSMVGKTGPKGERGYPGERGVEGASGATFIGWKIDKRNFVAIPFMSNGKIGPPLYLREFFEEYFAQTNQRREPE